MMSSYVCRQCRARLVPRAVSLRNPQWQPRATFISLRNEQAAPHEAHDTPQDESAPKNSENATGVSSIIRKVEIDPTRDPARDALREPRWGARKPSLGTGRYSKYAQNTEAIRKGHPGEFMEGQSRLGRTEEFPSVTKHVPNYPESAATREPNSTRQEISESHAIIMQRNIRDGDLNRAWDSFLRNYASRDSASYSNPSFQDVRLLNRGYIFGQLLESVNDQFCRGIETPVSPSGALFAYEQTELARPEFWIKTIVKLTHELLFTISGAYEGRNHPDALLSELTSVWRLFFQCKGARDDPLESIAVDWQTLPDAEVLSKPGTAVFQMGDFGRRLQTHHPKFVGNAALGFSAVTFFNLFDKVNQDVLKVSDSVREQGAPFLRLLTHLLAGSVVRGVLKHTLVSPDFIRLPEEFRNAVINQIKSAPLEAMLTLKSGGNTEETVPQDERASNQEEFFRKRIHKAVLQQEHSGILENIWEQVLKAYSPGNSRGNDPIIPEQLYNSLLTGFMALSLPERSVEVWNHIIASGINPDVKTWTAMLDGCSRARDLDGLNAIWARLLKSGIEPDEYAWTTRVHALISLRQINGGFAALDQMGKKWIVAETAIKSPPKTGNKKLPKVTINHSTKPSIEVVNGAITALVQVSERALTFAQKKDFVQKVLQWAGNFSLKPDARTYNTLIMMYIKGGDYTTSFKLLRQMEKEAILPDVATYTMLIRSAFDNEKFANLSESEQADRVVSIFTELETGGVELNTQIYSSIVDRLLKQYENFTAVRAVIDHMMSRKIMPSPHIYTSLVTQYFQQTPPNIAAVDALWMQILSTLGMMTDKILFDRIIEGYAANGEVGRMMAILTRMSMHGKLPSWNALTAVVTALGQAGDWERIHQIIRDVQRGEGVGKGGVTGGRKGQEFFFHVVVEKLGIDLAELGAQAGGDGQPMQLKEGRAEQARDASQDGNAEQQEAQRLWNEQLDSTGTDEPSDVDARKDDLIQDQATRGDSKDANWREEDNGSMGGVPL
ncbi:hypothetical protein K505DRAFT_305303 [Melanomma pulvis-pyrius CBS 109.77]|uniref:Pentatricopeptide repeat protein n=1 Tax=Melanomma pulvis-pyrius CBS 109.77 TaxID=1314802 RepID=A0A6A6XB60_9PLEO|nr:hypothetical protein K505DRAFT_305303 [Melanomma pulvis-pyrius CBS 109.77]